MIGRIRAVSTSAWPRVARSDRRLRRNMRPTYGRDLAAQLAARQPMVTVGLVRSSYSGGLEAVRAGALIAAAGRNRYQRGMALEARRPHDPAMFRRIVALALWTYFAWYLGAMLAAFTGGPTALGPMLASSDRSRLRERLGALESPPRVSPRT